MESSLAAAMAAGATAGAARAQTRPGAAGKGGGGKGAKPELYELRIYQTRIGAQAKAVQDFLGEVYVPTMNRLGSKPIGVFTVKFGPQVPQVIVLTPFESFAAFTAAQDKLPGELQKASGPAADAYLRPPAGAPAYVRSESLLLQAFDSLPRLEAPEKKPRIFELRTYETPGELANAKKMEMFTPKLGELEIFRRVGLTPVFFGKTLVGPRQPSFVYMLTFPDLAARDRAWGTFVDDPEWKKLKATPGYSDAEIMANITDLILAPAASSQI
jgi:hypothetical protein